MSILVTGAAGFIGFHIAKTLLKQDEQVIGIDNLNNYYDVSLKKHRLKELQYFSNFKFYNIDISKRDFIEEFPIKHKNIDYIIHLAAQAGIRYSVDHPHIYADTNMVGHLNMLELCRNIKDIKHFVYASSSSVYGGNKKLPFSINDPTDNPLSLYGATKKSCELMSFCYQHLYGIPATGLRYFTVYGPFGRPDMAAFIFTKAILKKSPIHVFNKGDMKRNFTYIDDVVDGTIKCLKKLPSNLNDNKVYNVGNNKSEPLMHFINILENLLDQKAKFIFDDMHPGDVKETVADIKESICDFGFSPKTNIEGGLKRFVNWYRSYYNV
ncbi:MAG: NAD-dependent epimerase/dehydratase family protein [Alphaproteobacteria bacterium]